MNNNPTNILSKCVYLANCFASKAERFIIQENGKQIRTVDKYSELDLLNHFLGKARFGISPDVKENCIFAEIDIDRVGTEQKEQFDFALKIKKELLLEYDLQALVEQSKSKGYHVIIPFNYNVKRKFIQKLLTKIIQKFTDKKIANGIIEIFPKGNGGTSIFFPCFNSVTPDGNSLSETFLTTKSTAIIKDNEEVDTNFIENFARAAVYNIKILQMLEWLDKYPPCFTKAYQNWAKGVRNSYTLAIAGICKKQKFSLDEAIEIITTIADDCNDEELQARKNIVKATYEKENPAGCSIMQGKNNGIPTDAICFKNCEFVELKTIDKFIPEQEIDIASFMKGYTDLKQSPPINYLANNLFPRGYVSVFFSEAGLGKTWLLMALSIDISNGRSIWGIYPTIQLKILFFQGDSPEHLTTERLEFLSLKPNDNYLRFVNRYDLDKAGYVINISDANGQHTFEKFIQEFSPDLIIIDTFISFFDGDECRAKDVKASTDFLRKIAANYNCHIILTSHARKRQAGEKRKKLDISDLIGSSALNRLVGSIYCIIQNNEDEDKTGGVVTNIKNWSKKTKSFKFELKQTDDNHLSIEYNHENINYTPKNKQEEIENHILDAIELYPEIEIRKDEIANDFNASINTVGLVIKKLEAKKILRKVGETKGAYYIANTEKNCKNNTEIADNNTFEPEIGIDRKIVRFEKKFNPTINPTIDITGSNETSEINPDLFN